MEKPPPEPTYRVGEIVAMRTTHIPTMTGMSNARYGWVVKYGQWLDEEYWYMLELEDGQYFDAEEWEIGKLPDPFKY